MDCIGQLIITAPTCDDSFAWARELLPMASDGTVLIAHNLTHARGRQGRIWVLADGQISHTIILKPDIKTHKSESLSPLALSDCAAIVSQGLPILTMALALGLWQPLQKFGATLKWPNDLSLNNKKLSGMLIQNLWHDNQLTGIIFGYSINVNNSCINNEQLKDIATSLSDATGTKHDLGLLQTELFASLSRFYEQWKRGEFHEIFKLWRKNQGYLGKQIQVHNRDGSLLEGIAQDVLPCGALVLKTEQTEPIIVSFAQVEEVKI